MTGRVFVSIATEPDSPSPFGCVTLLHIRQRRTSQSGRRRFISGPGYYAWQQFIQNRYSNQRPIISLYTWDIVIVGSCNIRKRSVLDDRNVK